MSKRKHQGLSPHRLKDNPPEKEFAEAWRLHNERGRTLDYLLHHPVSGGLAVESTEREDEIAATVIQWLGSPVGQHFLEDLGYTKSLPNSGKTDGKKKPSGVRQAVRRGVAKVSRKK